MNYIEVRRTGNGKYKIKSNAPEAAAVRLSAKAAADYIRDIASGETVVFSDDKDILFEAYRTKAKYLSYTARGVKEVVAFIP